MPPKLTGPARSTPTAAPPPPPEPLPGVLTPQNVALFAVLLVAEAVLLVLMLRRVEGPDPAIQARDISNIEYIDLDPVVVPVHPSRSGIDINLALRVEASLLVSGTGGERARARELVRSLTPKIHDEIARTVGAQTAEQAVDPGNRERIKDRLRAALNQSVFREDIVEEVVFRYYGP
ncbi:MAG: flagellar basal body-associated FliL family protein [Planctomycetes bacterium]|nr:flagellar basal body-associated FliL family protein [Planctomycetota bacterium]